VRKKLGVASKETAWLRLEKLVDFGFLEEDETKRGKGRGSPRHFLIHKMSGAGTLNVFPSPAKVEEKSIGGGGSKTAEQDVQDEQKKSPSRSSRSSRSAVFTPSPPIDSSTRQKSGNGAVAHGAQGLTARERIDAARGAGGKLTLWSDGTWFDLDLTLVLDATVRNALMEALADPARQDEILAELKGEGRRS
jgi:hypothetical protein